MDKKDPLAYLSARLASITSERADAIERGEASLDEDLDLRIAGAATLDTTGAELLGYDVRTAGRAKHKDVRPYEDGDPRAAAWARGQAQALAEIEGRIGQLSNLLGALGRLPDAGPASADDWRTETAALLAATTPLTADQARGFVEAARDPDQARQLATAALSVGIRTIGDYRRYVYGRG